MPTQKRGSRRSAHRQKRKSLDEKGIGSASQELHVYDWTEPPGLVPISPLELDLSLHAKEEKNAPLLPLTMEINVEKWRMLWRIWGTFKSAKTTKHSFVKNEPKFDKPTAIQCQAWPLLLAAKRSHAVLIAPTGSGKTLAYGLPLVVDALSTESSSSIQGIVIVPTRELALQVQSTFDHITVTAQVLTSPLPSVNVVACYGGVQSSQEQLERLPKASFVTATPGRLLDLLPQMLSLDPPKASTALAPHVTVVLDEADRLATHTDLLQQVAQIWQLLREQSNSSYRCILCSATWPQRATPIWKEWWSNSDNNSLNEESARSKCSVITIDTMAIQTINPHRASGGAASKSVDDDGLTMCTSPATNVLVPPAPSTPQDDTNESTKRRKTTRDASVIVSKIPSHIKQVLHVCAEHKKPKKLLHTLDILFGTTTSSSSSSSPLPTGIIFFDKIKTIQYIHQLLQKERPHIPCAPWHSQLQASQRERVFSQFIQGGGTNSKASVLLATDVAARGVHTANLQFVIHYDFPSNIEQYVHRCGRAGRGATEDSSEASVYSFFTRNLAPLAPDMITLLEATNQWVDPNLLALVRKPKNPTADTKAREEAASMETKQEKNPSINEYNSDNEEDDPFIKQLLANRIVLKRASHVSDPSSSEESDDEAGGV